MSEESIDISYQAKLNKILSLKLFTSELRDMNLRLTDYGSKFGTDSDRYKMLEQSYNNLVTMKDLMEVIIHENEILKRRKGKLK